MAPFAEPAGTSTAPTGRIDLLAGVPATSRTTLDSGAGDSARTLESSDRGFPVVREAEGQRAAASDSRNTLHGVKGLYRGEDLEARSYTSGRPLVFDIPSAAFVHTDSSAIVHLDAMLVDGRPLPSWLDFDPISGRFIGRAPLAWREPLEIRIVARDQLGNEAENRVRIEFTPSETDLVRDPSAPPSPDAAPPRSPAEATVRATTFAEQLRQARSDTDRALHALVEPGTDTASIATEIAEEANDA